MRTDFKGNNKRNRQIIEGKGTLYQFLKTMLNFFYRFAIQIRLQRPLLLEPNTSSVTTHPRSRGLYHVARVCIHQPFSRTFFVFFA